MRGALALLIPLYAAAGWAGQLTGVVRSAGLPIPGATVTATQGSNQATTTTDEAGRYDLDDLGPGVWTVEIRMVGFARFERQATVAAGTESLDADLTVETAAAPRGSLPPGTGGFQRPNVASLTAEREVAAAMSNASSAAPATPPDASNANEAFLMNGTLSSGLQQAQQEDPFMRGGPVNQQTGFGQGVPGTEAAGAPGGFMGGPGGRGGFGGPGGWRDGPGGPRGPMRPGARDANFGNRMARNRNRIHGAAFFNLDNSALDARPFSLTGQEVAKPSYAQARFGGVLGGSLNIPKLVHSDRTFFFLSYFGTRSRQPYSAVSTVPTADERAGDFSQASVNGAPVQIFDPTTHQQFPGNLIPLSRIDAASRSLLAFIPLPNQPGQVQNYQIVSSTLSNTNNTAIRLNHSLTTKDSVDFFGHAQWRNSTTQQLYGFQDSGDGTGSNFAAGWRRNLSPRTINSLRVNFSRNRNETVPFFAYGANVAAELGINGVSDNPINYGPPNLSFTNFGGLTDASALRQVNQTAEVTESVTLVRGEHTITFGGDYRRMQINTVTDADARGSFVFGGQATSAFDAQGQPVAGTGFDFADFLLGLPQSSSVRFGDSATYLRGSAYDAFVQDDWKIRSNLTINVGLRYEYFTPFREKYNHMANLDIAPGFSAVAVVVPGTVGPYTGRFPDGLINPDTNNFSPRIGLAWTPFPKREMVIRAGYGIYYNGSIYSQLAARLVGQPPFASTATLVATADQPLTLENGFATAPSQTITNTFAVDRNYRVGYAQTWNFAIQQTLPHSFVAELGYLGTKGTRLDIQGVPNRFPPGSVLTATERQIADALGFTFENSDGDSIYHALQARLQRRFSKGMALNALYAFSKSIDNASTIGGGTAVVAQNEFDLAAERGLSSFDRRHTLSVFYILTSPVSETSGLLRGSRWATRLLRDWTLSGGVTAQSGLPFTARVLGNLGNTAGTGVVGSGRANATGQPVDTGSGFFNLAAFALPPSGQFGNAGRNTIPGPGQLSLSLSFGRAFQLDERRRLEIRVESQNFTNSVSYTAIATVVNASNYGLATAAQPMRTITLTARLRF
jgi:hypothetical protein